MREVGGDLLDLSAKVVLVTGAAHGQGAAHARQLSALGAAVVLADLDVAALARTAADLTGPCLSIELDVRDAGAWRAVVDAAVSRFGRVDVLVNNAGVLRKAPLAELSEADLRFVLDVDPIGSVLGMQAVLPAMGLEGRSSTSLPRPR